MLTFVQDNPEKKVEMRKIKETHMKTHMTAKKLEKHTKNEEKHPKTQKTGKKRKEAKTCTKRYAPEATLGVPWGRFARPQIALGRFSSALGRSWDALGSLMEASWGSSKPLGRPWEKNSTKKIVF